MKTPDSLRSLERLLRTYIESSELLENSEIARQRVRAIDAYHGKNHRSRPGLSNHVSRDVFDVVESEKALLLETFSSSRKIIRFRPRDADDVEPAKLRNAYLNHLFWEKNDGYRLLYDGIHDALTEKICAYRWFWVDDVTVDRRQVSCGDAATLSAAVSNMAAQGWREDGVVQNGVGYDVTFTRTRQTGRVQIKSIPPDRLRIDPCADSLESAAFVGEECDLSGSNLVAMGVSIDRLDRLTPYDRVDSVVSRARSVRTSFRVDDNSRTPDQELYRVVSCYIRVDLDGDGISELYHCWAGVEGELLTDPDPVESIQVVAASLLPIPHTFYGLSTADALVDVQHTNSDIKRQMIDHLARVNSQRVVADIGGGAIRNPLDLIDNPVGGVIDAAFMGGGFPIQPLAQTPLSPATTSILEVMAQEKEGRGGVSRLGQGVNQGALSNQNADSLIERMTTAANRRSMMKARLFAWTVLKPLLTGVYRLAIEMDSEPLMLRVGGQWREVSPKSLGDAADLYVDIAVTEDEAIQRANTLLMIDQRLSASPRAAALYPEEKQLALLTDALDMLGESSHLYVNDPSSPEAVQSITQLQQQAAQLQQQNQALSQQLQMLTQQHAELRVQFLSRREELAIRRQADEWKRLQADRDLNRRDDAERHDQAVDIAKLELEQQRD